MLAIERHGQFGAVNAEIGLQFRAIRVNTHHLLEKARAGSPEPFRPRLFGPRHLLPYARRIGIQSDHELAHFLGLPAASHRCRGAIVPLLRQRRLIRGYCYCRRDMRHTPCRSAAICLATCRARACVPASVADRSSRCIEARFRVSLRASGSCAFPLPFRCPVANRCE